MNSGTYLLITHLQKTKNIKIGSKYLQEFPWGFYVYVGSAMNNLDKRISRHLSQNKRFHWHIDWFLVHAIVIALRRVETDTTIECLLSRTVWNYTEKTIMHGFGSSDCRCKTHLHYFKVNPLKIIDNAICHRISQIQLTRHSAESIRPCPEDIL